MRVEKAAIESYGTYLKDKPRPPSRGGNTRAWHQQVVRIGENYSFLAAHAGRFVYKSEIVSFEWEWDDSKRYRNIVRESVIAWNAKGEPIIRSNRQDKRWRSASTRAPGRDN